MPDLAFTDAKAAKYSIIAERVAGCLMRDTPGCLDTEAMGKDDYTHELVVHSWLSLRAWEGKKTLMSTQDDEMRFVCRCIWNKMRALETLRRRRNTLAPFVLFTENHEGTDTSFEDRIFMRQTLRLLQKRLAPKVWTTICRIAMEGVQPGRSTLRTDQRISAEVREKVKSLSPFL